MCPIRKCLPRSEFRLIVVHIDFFSFQFPAFTVSLLSPKGATQNAVEAAPVCTSLVAFNSTPPNASSTCYIFTGHMNGCISVANFGQRRQIRSWLAHPPNCQVIGLAIHDWSSPPTPHLISQGRDGLIKFWPIDKLTVCTSNPSGMCFIHDSINKFDRLTISLNSRLTVNLKLIRRFF